MLWAFSVLHAEGLPVRLTICGATMDKQESYWEALRSEYTRSIGTAITFYDFIPRSEVVEQLAAADMFCSCTLGEGCSHSRTTALCAGLPVVTTACGEMPELLGSASHIRLAAPGDPEGYLSTLRTACIDFLENRLRPDEESVKRWREHFTMERELSQWESLIASL